MFGSSGLIPSKGMPAGTADEEGSIWHQDSFAAQ